MHKIRFLGHKGSPNQKEYAFPKFGKVLVVGELYDARELGILGEVLVRAGNAVHEDLKDLTPEPPKLRPPLRKERLARKAAPKPEEQPAETPEESGPAED